MMLAGSRRLVTILGLDTVRAKTLYQAEWLQAHGLRVRVLTLHRDPGSIAAHPAAAIEAIPGGALARIRQLVGHLWSERSDIHHVELYVGGRFAFVYALICRLMRVPLLAVERGDLLQCQRRVYGLSARLSIYACYRLADRVWLREPYMLRAFRRWRVKGRFFLPNAVPIPAPPPPASQRDIDLLWVNRLIPERHPGRFASAVVAAAAARPLSCEVLGTSATRSGPRVTELEAEVVGKLEPVDGCHVRPFADPTTLYRRARFFVLPADVVFGNFSLLEAMSHGAVPIVSDVEGTSELVEDGRNGLVARHDAAGLREALMTALELSPEQWSDMSAAARRTIEDRFSIDDWGHRLSAEYAVLRSGQ